MGAAVFFCESSPNIGGQELQLLQQAQGLQQRGWLPVVLCRPEGRIAREAALRGLQVEPVRFRNALDLASIRRVMSLARRLQPLAVVCHSGHDANVGATAVHLAAALGLLRPRPKLVRMRTYQPGRPSAFAYNHLFDASFTPSQALRRQLLESGTVRPERVQVLYPGIDFDGLARSADAGLPAAVASRLQGAGPVIAHAAMLRGEKGHAFMLGVVKELAARFPNLLYVAAGEGALLEELRQQAVAEGIERHVLFAGMLQPVAPLLRRADVVVMPSRYEPLGMSQIEALALGVPVVVSRVGGLPETVEDGVTGTLCPAPHETGARQAWVEALGTVLSDPERARQQARRGRDVVLQKFGAEANLQGLMAAWADASPERKSPPHF